MQGFTIFFGVTLYISLIANNLISKTFSIFFNKKKVVANFHLGYDTCPC